MMAQAITDKPDWLLVRNIMKKLTLLLVVILLFSIGTIYAQSPDPVELTWTASPSTDILAGYNMYRSEVSGEGYVKINDELIPMLAVSYVDSDLEWDKTYYYVCRAVSIFLVGEVPAESINSNEAMWAVDTPPAPLPPCDLDVKKKVN